MPEIDATSPETQVPAAGPELERGAPPGDPAPAEGQAPEAVRRALERLVVGRTPDVRPHDAWAEAGRKVLRFHLFRMLARVPGVIAGDDPEEVHAMRVAARRMRAALRVFGDGFEQAAIRRYRDDLREIGARLGAVRDLDVLLEILAVYEDRHGERARAGLGPLRAAWLGLREARRAELVALLESEQFAAFVDEYVELTTTEGLAARSRDPLAPGLVRNCIPSRAWSAYEAVWAFDHHLAAADLATLHRLRIDGKWLRYTLEFVRDPLEPEASRLIPVVVALQDHIGVLHDMHVAATLARELAADPAGPSKRERRAIEGFVRHNDEGVLRLQRALGPTWKPLVAPEYRRRLGRALARL
jgi:CHAD domain-containing protein